MIPDAVWIVLAVIALVVCIVEWRIMRKPPSERTAREQRFLAADRKSARSYRRFTMNVYPIVAAVLSALMILLAIPFWAEGRTGLAIGFTVFGAAGVVGMFFLWRYLRSHQNAQWQQNQDEKTAAADREGRPRWFTNTRGGIALGVMFSVFGVGFLIIQAISPHHGSGFVLPAIMLVIGILAIVAAVAQRRGEQSHR